MTPETLFIPSYKSKDIQMLQREDKDFGILHSWLDDIILPSRDKVDQYSQQSGNTGLTLKIS